MWGHQFSDTECPKIQFNCNITIPGVRVGFHELKVTVLNKIAFLLYTSLEWVLRLPTLLPH